MPATISQNLRLNARNISKFGACLLVLFIVHRQLSTAQLNTRKHWSLLDAADHFLVGSLSDLWISGLVMLSFWICFSWVSPKRVKPLLILIMIFVGVLLTLHQIYTEFFSGTN